ncbi:MAG: glycoside hydrolase family 25 protein [Bacteroidales bacterium]|nr:glycoside hydrolase family 25 protein [Bacteroidales bacterium]
MTKKRKNNKAKKILFISCALIFLCILVSVAYIYGRDYYRKYYACPTLGINYNKYPVVGIDISSHQGDIDWQLVSESNISFAFMKATEGEDFVDKNFDKNWKKAKANNIITGAYLFYRFNKDGKIQADNFINTVKLEDNDLPPVVDFELSYGNRFSSVSHNQIQNHLLKCLLQLEKHYKCKPIIYTNVNTYNKYIKGSFDDYPLWLCKLCTEPSLKTWTFWQYTHKGIVPGIKGSVDMNFFNGSYPDFVDYVYETRF